METVLERAKSQYDLVVIDTPPLTAVSDAFPLLSKVDGVVIVGRLGSYGGYGYTYDYAAGGGRAASADGGPPAGGASPNGAGSAEQPVSSPQG